MLHMTLSQMQLIGILLVLSRHNYRKIEGKASVKTPILPVKMWV